MNLKQRFPALYQFFHEFFLFLQRKALSQDRHELGPVPLIYWLPRDLPQSSVYFREFLSLENFPLKISQIQDPVQ